MPVTGSAWRRPSGLACGSRCSLAARSGQIAVRTPILVEEQTGFSEGRFLHAPELLHAAAGSGGEAVATYVGGCCTGPPAASCRRCSSCQASSPSWA